MDISNLQVRGCIDHSKQVEPGDLFISQTFNREFVDEAIQRGAVAVLSEFFIQDCLVPQIIIPSQMRDFIDRVSVLTYEMYGKDLKVIGVTGTNGKTTVTSFIGQLLMQQQKSVCVIGTLGVYVNGVRISKLMRSNTTLPFFDFIQVVKYCFEQEVQFIVLEASSQGLLDYRLGGYPIDIGVFLNIGRDHLEFHGGMVPYKKSKELLAHQAKQLVINANDEWCQSVADKAIQSVYFFGDDTNNDVVFETTDFKQQNTIYSFLVKKQQLKVKMKNSGYYNGLNLAAALAVLASLDILPNEIKDVTLPKGRLEQIGNNFNVEVLVDYAHTPDALEASLSAVASFAEKNVFVVFGCGGNRDRKKRKEMGEVALKYATKAIITSDNPRDEQPEAIIAEIVKGLNPTKIMIEKDRKKAIILALSIARKGDIVLIAGKGHEQEQIINGQVAPFSDQEVVRNYFEELGGVITKNDPVA